MSNATAEKRVSRHSVKAKVGLPWEQEAQTLTHSKSI